MDFTSDDLPTKHEAYLLTRLIRRFHATQDEEDLRSWADKCNATWWGFPDGSTAYLDADHLDRLLAQALAAPSEDPPVVF